jgi:arylsulfatase A-like enzyme
MMKFLPFRKFTKFYLFLVICLIALVSCNQKVLDKPNVVLIVVDDLGYADLSCTGLSDDVSTPNIDRLANSGVRFTQAYATSPICSPSRAGLITGSYQQRWDTWWYGGPGMHDPKYKTLAEILKDDGYNTGYVGKVHYGSFDSDTSNRSFPLNHGFDYYFGHTSARKHYMIHSDDFEYEFQQIKNENNKKGQSLRKGSLWKNKKKLDTLAFSTELFGKEACRFIRENKNQKFFLQLSFNAVHNFTHQLPESYLNKHGLKAYPDWDPASEEYYDWYVKGRKPNNPEGREHYLGQLYYLDKEIGRVLDQIKESGIDRQTLIIFISDNGGSTPIYANNYPLRGSKYLLYEGGIRVPMIISYPGVYKNSEVLDNVVSAMAILPTICSELNISTEPYIDGLDVSALLKGANTSLEHDTLVWDVKHEMAVRAGDWKLHCVYDDRNAKYEMVEVELGTHLYNLAEDPGEKNDLAEKFPGIVDQLLAYHKNWMNNISAH